MQRQRITSLLISLACCSFACRTAEPQGPQSQEVKSAQLTLGAASSEFMAAVNHRTGAFYIDRYEVSELTKDDHLPVINQIPLSNVTAEQASELCKRYGKRLCTELEWKNACLGTQGKRFGHSNQAISGRCNLNGSEVRPAGAMRECLSASGVYDMVGNLMEWVDAGTDHQVTAMGGSFRSDERSDCFTTHYYPRDTKNDQIGFRCCL